MTAPFRRTLSTGFDHLEVRDSGPTQAEIDAFAQKWAEKKAADYSPHPLDGIPAVPHQHRPLNSWEPERLTERPGWHATMTPPEVAERWEALLAAVEAVEESSASVKALGADEAAERRRYDAAVARAVRAGDPVPEPGAVTDWRAERTKREAVDRVRQQQAADARREYDAAVREALPSWRAAVEAELPKLTAAAEQVVERMRPAVSKLAAAHDVLAAMAEDSVPTDRRDVAAQEQARAVVDHHRGRTSAARVGLARLAEALA
ncbi:hypothetical protein ACI782_02850 [Geodermatophilus sp. SYSU D00703]